MRRLSDSGGFDQLLYDSQRLWCQGRLHEVPMHSSCHWWRILFVIHLRQSSGYPAQGPSLRGIKLQQFKISRAAIFAAGFLINVQAVDANQGISPSAFLSQYRSALNAQVKNQNGYQIDGKEHYILDRLDGKPPMRDESYLISDASNGQDRSLRFINSEGGYLERKFLLRKSRVSFSMRSAAAGRKYGLEFLDPIPPNLLTFKSFLGDSPRSIGTQLITSIIDSPGFKVKRAMNTTWNGRDVVRVEFDYRPSDPKAEYDMVGELTLDPSNDLAILEYSVKRQISLSDGPYYREITGSVTYSKLPGCRLLPESVIVIEKGSTATQPKLKIIQEFHADKVSDVAPADSEFSPEHYGLASLDRPRARPGNYTPYWAFGIALVAIGLTVLLRRLSK